MALGNKRNILIGASAVFLGPAGTTKPATVTRASFLSGAAQDGGIAQTFGTGSAVTDWRNVGYTQDGLEIANDPSWGEVEVDQLLDTPAMFKDGMTFSISTTFAEATLENLLIAWGQAASTLVSTANDKTITLRGGSLGEAPVERGLIAIGNAPKAAGASAYRERVYHAYNVLSVEGSGHTMARAEATVIPVTFRAMPDDVTGDYGTIRDALT